MTQEEKTSIEERIVDVLKTVYDPEIPVDIWNRGMIYRVDVKDDYTVEVDMTFTAPSCPAADFILEDVRQKLMSVKGPEKVDLRLSVGLPKQLKVLVQTAVVLRYRHLVVVDDDDEVAVKLRPCHAQSLKGLAAAQ